MSRSARVIASFLLLLLMLPASALRAQDDDKLRVFLRFDAGVAERTALDAARLRFTSDVLRVSEVVFAGSSEQDVIFAQCRDDMGVAETAQRECQLKAARRENVAQLLEIGLVARGPKGHYELSLRVWDPDDNAEIHADLVELDVADIDTAAREGLSKLAHSYLDFLCRKQLAAARCETLPKGSASLELLEVSPAPARVFIDEIELEGSAPGTFTGLPKGKHSLTLRADGHEEHSRSIELSSNKTLSIAKVTLAPKPAKVSIRANVSGAAIRLDGQKVGSSSADKPFSMVVLPDSYELSVSLEGYQTFSQPLTLSVGQELELVVHLLTAEEAPDCPSDDPRCPETPVEPVDPALAQAEECEAYACIADSLPECQGSRVELDCPELLRGELAKVYLQERIDALDGDFEQAFAEIPGGVRELVEQRLTRNHFLMALRLAGGYGNLSREGGEGIFRIEGKIGYLGHFGDWRSRYEGGAGGWLGGHFFGGADNFDTLFGGAAARLQCLAVPSLYVDAGAQLSYTFSSERFAVGPRLELGLDLENLVGVYLSGDVHLDEEGTRFAAMLGFSFSWQLAEIAWLLL